MHIIRPRAYSQPVLPDARVTILGGGDVTKSVLLSASLLRPSIPFRVIVRSDKSAELIHEFLNDLPKLRVEVEALPLIPDLSNELVVLALGAKTGRFSKKKRKEALYKGNEALVRSIAPQISTAVNVVVTNPSTAITRFLVEMGIAAYGIGVGNDQLRFSNQAGDTLQNHFLTGAHNFHELVLGSRHSKEKTRFSFDHKDYKHILRMQDRKRLSLSNFPNSIFDFRWEWLAKINAAFPPEYKWYARQRIHSKFHRTCISCSLSVLNAVCAITRRPTLQDVFSLELPLYFPGEQADTVIGWPLDATTLSPLELAFDNLEAVKLQDIRKKYSIHSGSRSTTFYLTSPFGDRIALQCDPEFAHSFYETHVAHLFSLSSIKTKKARTIAEICVVGTRDGIDRRGLNPSDESWRSVPQHRGKNPQEHTDLQVLDVPGGRLVQFPGGEAIAQVDDRHYKVDLYCPDSSMLRHELRRMIRDEIGIPVLVSRGARVLHAGLLSFKDVNILIVGRSGGGKTTAILSLLCADHECRYGAAERTLVWAQDNRLLALGIPESVTVFPGTLAALPEFRAALGDYNPEVAWTPRSKVRLQQDEILHSSGASSIQRPELVDLVVEVVYDPVVGNSGVATVVAREEKKRILITNDLTEKDPVRLPWLHWFEKSINNSLYDSLLQDGQPLDFYSVRWSDIDKLRNWLIDIVARKKLYAPN